MGISKSAAFSQAENNIARLAKALAHPARVAIIQYLLEKKSCHCGGLVEELPLSQATVSQHLKELKQAGLIKGEIERPRMCYCINESAWQEAGGLFASLFAGRPGAGNCC